MGFQKEDSGWAEAQHGVVKEQFYVCSSEVSLGVKQEMGTESMNLRFLCFKC